MISKLKSTTLSILLLLPLVIIAQAESIFNSIELSNSLEDVTEKISEISNSITLYSPVNVVFPLANKKEDHLVCTDVKTNNGIIDKVVFTFSDDKLSYIQAKGNAYNTFNKKRKDTARSYMDYKVYVKDRLFLKQKEDIAWIVTAEGMHTNLFTWNNPYFTEGYSPQTITSENIPEFLKMGETLDVLKPILEVNSAFTFIQELDGSDSNAQLQINCFGIDYLGFPRKAEARFGDGKLNIVWILTGKGEEDRIRIALTKQYGKPIFVNEVWEVFNSWQVALRKDKPEVLLIEQKLGLEYKTSYFKQ